MLLVWMCKSKVTVACWCLSALYAFLSRFMSILKDWKFVFKNRKPYHSKTRDLGVFSVVKKRLESVKIHRLSKKSLNIWLFRSKVLNTIESSMPNAWKALKTSTDIECWATILIGTRKLSSTLSNNTRATKLWTALARTFRRLVRSSVSISLFHFPTCAQWILDLNFGIAFIRFYQITRLPSESSHLWDSFQCKSNVSFETLRHSDDDHQLNIVSDLRY